MHIFAHLHFFILSSTLQPAQAQSYSSNTTNSTGSIPQCALECINPASLKAGCAAGDYPCSCQHFANISLEARPCIMTACHTTQELPQVCPGITNLCNVYKVPVPEGCVVNVTLAGGGGSEDDED